MSFFDFFFPNDKDIVSFCVRSNLNRAVTARIISNKDFDIEMIGIAFVKLSERVLPLTKHDKNELEKIRTEAIELRNMLSNKMRELEIYDDVEKRQQEIDQINEGK